MKTKKIALLVAFIICLGIASSLTTISAVESPKLVEGEYQRVSWKMFENHLWVESTGLCIQGMHTYGPTTKTDLLVVGGGQDADVSLQGYYPNMTNHLPVDYHNDAEYSEKIRDSVKVNNGGEMELIYASGYLDQTDGYDPDGMIVCQDFVNPTKNGDNDLVPEWTVSTSDEVYALTLGNFDLDADPEVAGVTFDGKVYMISSAANGGIGLTWDFSEDYWYRSNMLVTNYQINTPIAAIDDLDEADSKPQDIIVGHYENVTALSTHTSNSIIWDVEIGNYILDLVVVDDINSDGEQDVVVSTNDGLYLLNGADGSILSSIIEYGNYYCDVEVFNSTAVISGDNDGDVIIWDINTAAPSYNDTLENNVFSGWDINDLLVVDDLDGDGINEVAVGGDKSIGAVYGNNLTIIWSGSTYGSSWDGHSIDVYDIALLEDLSGDGFGDLGVTGWTSDAGMADAEGAVFVFSTYGALQFIPDLSGYGSVDSTCEDDSNFEFTFTATATQKKGIPITDSQINIDGVNTTITTSDTDWVNGVTYTYSNTFSDGVHNYCFYFEDDHGNIYKTPDRTFQVGNCGGGTGLDIPGMGVWMILASMSIGIALVYIVSHRRNH